MVVHNSLDDQCSRDGGRIDPFLLRVHDLQSLNIGLLPQNREALEDSLSDYFPYLNAVMIITSKLELSNFVTVA